MSTRNFEVLRLQKASNQMKCLHVRIKSKFTSQQALQRHAAYLVATCKTEQMKEPAF